LLIFLDFLQKKTLLTGTFPIFTTLAKEIFLLQQLYSFLIKGHMKAADRLVTTSGFHFAYSSCFYLKITL